MISVIIHPTNANISHNELKGEKTQQLLNKNHIFAKRITHQQNISFITISVNISNTYGNTV